MNSNVDNNFSNNLIKFTSNFFSQKGVLSKLKDFEFRPQQQLMATKVADTLSNNSTCLIEAETGVGKSLAYLVPAIQKAIKEDRKAIISTQTINLQEQLLEKDIPLLQSIWDTPFEATLLKGRRNYICPNRLKLAISGGGDLFTPLEIQELKIIWDWMEKNPNSNLSDINFKPSHRIWSNICSESHSCTPKICLPTNKCQYQNIKKEISKSHIIIINHTLFFTLLKNQKKFIDSEDGYLFPRDFLIFDEAHTLEQIAAKQLGLSFSQANLIFDINRLYNPKNKKGIFSLVKDREGQKLTYDLLKKINIFFTDIDNICRWDNNFKEFRVREPNLIEDSIGSNLIEVSQRARKISDLAKDSIRSELIDLAKRINENRIILSTFLDQSEDGFVYWVEKNNLNSISLNAVPINVSELISPVFFESNKPSIFTSATLSVGNSSLSYFKNRVGAQDIKSSSIGSPFDYSIQMSIHLVKKMPSPNDENYEFELIKLIEKYIKKSNGSAFVLFTNYSLMKSIASKMRPFFKKKSLTSLVQGEGQSRKNMIESFKSDTSSVLFGTDSFWTGVDVPGDSLKSVIITRIPFLVPNQPLIQSKLEYIENNGGNSFMEYSVPEAILKLKQGIGRLIRSSKDNGFIAILDDRVLTKPYGKSFINSFPNAPIVVE